MEQLQEIALKNEQGTQPNPVLNKTSNVKASCLDHNALFGYFLGEQKVTNKKRLSFF
jgi:hypothetical protein